MWKSRLGSSVPKSLATRAEALDEVSMKQSNKTLFFYDGGFGLLQQTNVHKRRISGDCRIELQAFSKLSTGQCRFCHKIPPLFLILREFASKFASVSPSNAQNWQVRCSCCPNLMSMPWIEDAQKHSITNEARAEWFYDSIIDSELNHKLQLVSLLISARGPGGENGQDH